MTQHTARFAYLMSLLSLTACVTINIYFPEAAAKEAADRIIDRVYGPQKQDAPPPAAEPQSQRRAWPRLASASLLDVLVPPAHAAEPKLDIQSPAIDALTRAMQARQADLQPHYEQGTVGLGHDGFIKIRDPGAIALRDRNRVAQLVKEENRDRSALYREIAQANGHPEWEAKIRQTFAGRWIAKAPAGWWYENAGGSWQRK